MKICAGVITYNRICEVSKTISAISDQGIALSDIYIFDNCSMEVGYESLTSKFPGINYIRFSENRSAAGGYSEAMKIALAKDYDWIWLFNDDSRPLPGALQSILPFMDDSSGFSIVQIETVDKNGYADKLEWKGVRVPVKIRKSEVAVGVDIVTFNGCMVKTSVIEKIGPCDPEFFMGTFEFEFCLRARDAGFNIGLIPNGRLEDGKIGSVGGVPPWREYYNTRNHLWLAISRRDFQIFRAWLWRELKFLAVIVFLKDKKAERLLFKFRAVRDALMGRRGKVYAPPIK